MAYDSTIPALGNLISNDIPAMQENFSLLESAQVVDEGSTEDGDYIRYENGWQICTKKVTITSVSFSSRGSVYRSDGQIWNFSVDFSEPPKCFANNYDSPYMSIATSNILTTSAEYYIFHFQDSSGNDVDTSLMAIGRWK